MVMETNEKRQRTWLSRLGLDIAYVLPGFLISTLAFMLLVTLFSVAVSTLIIWIGALLLPFTLYLASGFAELSRRRAAWWGAVVPPVRYRARGAGMTGLWQWVLDPRRWIDLLFETLIAFPLRVVTFSVAMTWIGLALGGVSWWAWALYIPSNDGSSNWPGDVLIAITHGAVPESFAHSYFFTSVVYGVIGLIAFATLPFVMRCLALLDASLTIAALGGSHVRGVQGAAGSRNAAVAPGHPKAWASSAARHTGHAGTASASGAPAPWGRGAAAVGGESGDTQTTSLPSAAAWGWIAGGFSAVAAIAVGWPILAAAYGVHVALAMLVIIAQAASLLLVMRFQQIAIALATVSAAAAALLTVPSDGPWPWPVSMLIVQAILVLLVALRAVWPVAVAAWLLPQLAVIIAALVIAPGEGGANLITSAAVTGALAALGVVIRSWTRSRGALLEAQAESAALDERQQRLAERNRVARELHDVVAHSMSVIGVQATTARYRLDGVSDAAAEEFESIAASSRVALGEMRGLLATLRDGEQAALSPQPSLIDLPELVEASRRAGATITMQQDETTAELPPAVGLTAYRIAQEGLSNAVRHAPGTDIQVRVGFAESEAPKDTLVVEVENTAVDDHTSVVPAPGAGAGLSGARDRALALGGTFAAGPTESGGYLLRATLPVLTRD